MSKIYIAGDFFIKPQSTPKFTIMPSEQILGEFYHKFRGSDLSILNLEMPLTNKETPLLKYGPNLRGRTEITQKIMDLGFNTCTLANNHIMDHGDYGLESTINACRNAGINILGAGNNNTNASLPLVKSIDGIRVATLNYCENEFIAATKDTPGTNVINLPEMYQKIKKLRDEVDCLIVILHGGKEYFNLPTPYLREISKFLIDVGANFVITHHSHVVSGYEIYKNGYIFYSLGNFMFEPMGQKNESWFKGFVLEINLKDFSKYILHPIKFDEYNLRIKRIIGKELEEFEKEIENLNFVLNDNSIYSSKWDKLIESESLQYLSNFSSIGINFYEKLIRRKMFPLLLSKKRLVKFFNLINCETHQEIIKDLFAKKIREMNDIR